ncbi:hypothetical protein HDV01_000807 [Terramyces sp. JEL0728]|nr:hypothetical protein HDV01_000807 [Terramyces sp. JEL0728]
MNVIRQSNQMLLYRNNNNLLYKSLYFCGIGHLAFWGFLSFQLYPQLDTIIDTLNKQNTAVTKDELVNVLGLTTSVGFVILFSASFVANRNIHSLAFKNNKLYLQTFSLLGKEKLLSNVRIDGNQLRAGKRTFLFDDKGLFMNRDFLLKIINDKQV